MSSCIVWLGRRNAGGYGLWGRQLAHRRVWATVHGPLPPELHLHHTCETRRCVNPEHLEPMTKGEHSRLHLNPRTWWERQRAATHCKNGHAFDEANTYWSKAGRRHCRTCDRLRHRQYKAAKLTARG